MFAADRGISRPDGSFDSVRRKVFPLPFAEGGVSYFGLAEVFPRNRRRYMSEWLQHFVNGQADRPTLKQLAFRLRDALHTVVPEAVLLANPSGFHIGGYNELGIPEFWFLTNIGGMDEYRYKDLKPRYAEPSADFLERDARTHGWDGVNLTSVENKVYIYRNGDYRAHVVAWDKLDTMLMEMSRFPDFMKIRTPNDYSEWVRFKLEVIAYFYKKRASRQIIRRPIDVFCFSRAQS